VDNQDTLTQTQDNTQTQVMQEPAPTQTITDASFSWKSQLAPDFANSPTMKNFADTKEGFNNAVKSHLELQKMMGHEKIPVPKGPEDKIAIDLFKKAFRIPEKPEGYGLPDVEMENYKFDKNGFAAAIHKHNLSPEQAKGVWQDYTELVKKEYAGNVKKFQDGVSEAARMLMTEWGDAYATKVELGQMVINKFSENPEMNDFITAQLVKDPRGIKFLAKLGEQFAENKIGDFKYQRHSLTPDEAQREISSIRADMNHPYNNEKAPQAERMKAIDYVNSLYSVVAKAKSGG